MAFALAAALVAGGLAQAPSAQAQSTADASTSPAPITIPVPGAPKIVMQPDGMITLREVAVIGTGVIVGAALFHAVIGHGFMVVGAVVGGWLGDWYYGTHEAPLHTGT